jgi:hypothetical protein
MLSRNVTVSRRARYVARLPDHSRPHGRRRGYDHARRDNAPCDQAKGSRSFPGFIVLAGVLVFLMLVVLGAMKPATGPLVKVEPVSTARVQ